MKLQTNLIKKKLSEDQTVVGSFVKFTDPAVTEIMALAGFDFIIFDMEHAPVELKQLENMIRAAQLGGTIPLARVPANRPELILRTMDLGLLGVHVPHVDTESDARDAVASVRYLRPKGRRGLAFSQRSAAYGFASKEEYLGWVEKQSLVVVQIESVQAFENIEAILKIDGVDIAFFGPADLSQSVGAPGNTKDPRVTEILEAAPTIIRRYPDKIAGIWVASEHEIDHYSRIGYRYFALSSDTGFLMQATSSAIKSIRSLSKK